MVRGCWVLAGVLWGCQVTNTDEPTIEQPVDDDVEIVLEPYGPDPAAVDAFMVALDEHPEVLSRLGDHRARRLNFFLESTEDLETGEVGPSSQFRAVYYDYDGNEAFEVAGDIDAPSGLTVVSTEAKPAPPLEEFQEAIEILLQDPAYADAYINGEISFFHAMPPVIDDPGGDRVIALGVRPTGDGGQEEIAGINMSAMTVVHYPSFTPPNAQVTGFACNPPPDAFETAVSRGTSGWAQLRMRRGGRDLWSFIVRRPSASSGFWGSGVELSDVRYRGKRILRKANLPILNVRYDDNTCGPYRDWQWQENRFTVGPIRSQVAPGIALVEWAKTIRETADDSGNYEGVAAYFDRLREEIVVLSEIEAGWYRYMTEWRFGLDGTIRPRFGFDAVENGCTCERHFHHAYWRLDFALGGSANNLIEAYSPVTNAWSTIEEEVELMRDITATERWRVIDPSTGDSVLIQPHAGEDLTDDYGIADIWVLANHTDEEDDHNAPAPFPTAAGLTSFVDGESVAEEDLVMWWGGHFVHDDADPTTNQTHTIEFRIRPDAW